MNNEEKIKELEFEKVLWLIFIFLSALSIYGDNLEQKFLIFNNKKDEQKSKKIFIFVLAISILIYLYFVIRNYKLLKSSEIIKKDVALYNIRLIGSILIVVGACFILYYEVNESTPFGTPTI